MEWPKYYLLRSEDMICINLPIIGYVAYHWGYGLRGFEWQTPAEGEKIEREYLERLDREFGNREPCGVRSAHCEHR